MPSNQSLQYFPQDVIKNNGSQLFDIMLYLTNKNMPGKAKIELG
jgi:hypothetical protein